MKTERETLETCVANLRALRGIKHVEVRDREADLPYRADARLVLSTNAGRFTYIVEVKRTVTPAGLGHFLQQLQRYAQKAKAKPLLLTDYVSLNLADRLIDAGVNFADAAGNIYLDWADKLHIQIQGRKPKRIAEAKSERLTQPSGLRVLYTLLTRPPERWGAYREIAKTAGVALGSIAVVMSELKAKGYLVQKGHDECRLTQRRKLLDLWVDGYGARLRPDLLIGRYQTPEPDPEQTLQVLRNELEDKRVSWALTGGFAADILTRHFRGEQVSMFVEDWPRDVLQRLRWLPSAEGRVTVLRKFSPLVSFDLEQARSYPVAHPLLVYAELIFQGRERELETAKILYDRYLTKLIREDGT